MTQLTARQFLKDLAWPFRWRLLGGVVVLLLSTSVMLSLPFFLKRIFDSALESKDPVQLAWFSIGMFVTVVVLLVLVMLRTHLIFATAGMVAPVLRQKLMAHILTLDLAWYERTPPGEVVSRIHEDVRLVTASIVTVMPILVRGTLLGIGSLLLLVFSSVKLTLVLLLAAVPIVAAGWWLGKRIKVVSRKQQDVLGQMSALVAETVSMVQAVMMFDRRDAVLARLAKVSDKYAEHVVGKAYLNSALLGVNLLIGFSALIGVLWLGGLEVMHGTMTMGTMLAFLLYLSFLADAVNNFGNFWPEWQAVLASCDRIMEVLRLRPTVVEPVKPKMLPLLGKGNARSVAFEEVTFAYESRAEAVVTDGVTLKVKAGQKAAIVGPSGAGKTTLFGLLVRFYDVQGGRVLLDGVDVRELSFADLRRSVAVVAQEPAIFSASVKENVTYGRPEATDEEVWAALKTANVDGFVEELPQGLKTMVGERGVQLSGGQRQRLAIARAVLVDAPVLLLDEATSHLDAESERAVQKALEHAGKGRTVLTIAHRLSTVRAADVIFVLDKGRVVAKGTHEELLEKSPLYSALARLQMAG